MPDGVTLPSADLPTSPPGTDFIPDPGNATNASMSRLTLGVSEPGLLPQGYPWIPALLVACGMVVFLSLSFYSHHKRVRRKRELLMDYLSVLLYSGVESRGRSVSILCNTNSLALSQLGKSFRITRDKKERSESSDFLTERYLNDLAEFSDSHKMTKNVLKRFISSPTESKFQHMASQLMSLNRATRPGRVGLANLARNLSVPEDFDPTDTDFPCSLSEARTSITQGVLLDPKRMQGGEAGNANPFKRSDTNSESVSDHSYENIAYSDQADFPKDFTTTTQPNVCFNRDDGYDLSVKGPKQCKVSSSQASSLRSMWFLSKPCVPASRHEPNDRPRVERWHLKSTSNLHPDRCVSVTRASVLPPCVHSLGMSCFTSRQTQISDLLHNNSFLAECKKDHLRYDKSLSCQYPEMDFSPVRSNEKSKKYNPRSGHEMSSQVLSEQESCVGGYTEHSSAPPPLQENISASFDPLSDNSSTSYSRDSSVHFDEVHDQSLDEMSRQHNFQFIDSSQILGYCRSLEGSSVGSCGRLPIPKRINSTDYNPMFPGETDPTVNTHRPTSFFPASFSHGLRSVGQDVTQADPLLPSISPHMERSDSGLNPIVSSRSTNLTIAKMMQSELHAKIPTSFRHSKTRSRGYLNKAMSTQSTKTLISGTVSPSQSFSNMSSDLLPASRTQRSLTYFHENPEMAPVSPNPRDSIVSNKPAAQFFFLDEPIGEVATWQMCDDTKCSGHHPSMTLQTMVPTSWKVPDTSKRMNDDPKDQLDTLISLDDLSPSAADSWANVRPASHMHRLPRFQVRSGMTQHRKLLARHGTVQDVDKAREMDLTDTDKDNQDSLCTSGPQDTQI